MIVIKKTSFNIKRKTLSDNVCLWYLWIHLNIPSASCLVSSVNTSGAHLSIYYAYLSWNLLPCDTWSGGPCCCFGHWRCRRRQEASSSASGCTELWRHPSVPAADAPLWERRSHTHHCSYKIISVRRRLFFTGGVECLQDFFFFLLLIPLRFLLH